MALYPPQALAIADGSVGLAVLNSHVSVPKGHKYRQASKLRSPDRLSCQGFFRL